MKLTKLLERLTYECVNGSVDVEVKDVINDSRRVSEGSLFICVKGAVTDGHTYVSDVVEKGAKGAGGAGPCGGAKACDCYPGGGQPLCHGPYLSSLF